MDRKSKRERRRKARAARSGIMNIKGIDYQSPRGYEFKLKMDEQNDSLLITNVDLDQTKDPNSSIINNASHQNSNRTLSFENDEANNFQNFSKKKVRFEDEVTSVNSQVTLANPVYSALEKNLDYLATNELVLNSKKHFDNTFVQEKENVDNFDFKKQVSITKKDTKNFRKSSTNWTDLDENELIQRNKLGKDKKKIYSPGKNKNPVNDNEGKRVLRSSGSMSILQSSKPDLEKAEIEPALALGRDAEETEQTFQPPAMEVGGFEEKAFRDYIDLNETVHTFGRFDSPSSRRQIEDSEKSFGGFSPSVKEKKFGEVQRSPEIQMPIKRISDEKTGNDSVIENKNYRGFSLKIDPFEEKEKNLSRCLDSDRDNLRPINISNLQEQKIDSNNKPVEPINSARIRNIEIRKRMAEVANMKQRVLKSCERKYPARKKGNEKKFSKLDNLKQRIESLKNRIPVATDIKVNSPERKFPPAKGYLSKINNYRGKNSQRDLKSKLDRLSIGREVVSKKQPKLKLDAKQSLIRDIKNRSKKRKASRVRKKSVLNPVKKNVGAKFNTYLNKNKTQRKNLINVLKPKIKKNRSKKKVDRDYKDRSKIFGPQQTVIKFGRIIQKGMASSTSQSQKSEIVQFVNKKFRKVKKSATKKKFMYKERIDRISRKERRGHKFNKTSSNMISKRFRACNLKDFSKASSVISSIKASILSIQSRTVRVNRSEVKQKKASTLNTEREEENCSLDTITLEIHTQSSFRKTEEKNEIITNRTLSSKDSSFKLPSVPTNQQIDIVDDDNQSTLDYFMQLKKMKLKSEKKSKKKIIRIELYNGDMINRVDDFNFDLSSISRKVLAKDDISLRSSMAVTSQEYERNTNDENDFNMPSNFDLKSNYKQEDKDFGAEVMDNGQSQPVGEQYQVKRVANSLIKISLPTVFESEREFSSEEKTCELESMRSNRSKKLSFDVDKQLEREIKSFEVTEAEESVEEQNDSDDMMNLEDLEPVKPEDDEEDEEDGFNGESNGLSGTSPEEVLEQIALEPHQNVAEVAPKNEILLQPRPQLPLIQPKTEKHQSEDTAEIMQNEPQEVQNSEYWHQPQTLDTLPSFNTTSETNEIEEMEENRVAEFNQGMVNQANFQPNMYALFVAVVLMQMLKQIGNSYY